MAIETPQSEVDVCNLALGHLKQRAIVQLDPPTTDPEVVCANWYQQVRRSTLRTHPWNFAIKRVEILPDATYTPEFGFTHAYVKPVDFIRLIGFYEDLGFVTNRGEFDLENDYILKDGTDNEAINVRYVSDVTNVGKMDPLFIDLFALNLAIRMAPQFTGGEARVKTLVAIHKEVKGEATAIDGQERPPRRKQSSGWLRKRRQGGYSTGPYTKFSSG